MFLYVIIIFEVSIDFPLESFHTLGRVWDSTRNNIKFLILTYVCQPNPDNMLFLKSDDLP